jgi:CRP-like cAMP-binding protein
LILLIMEKSALDFYKNCPSQIADTFKPVIFAAEDVILAQGDDPKFVYILTKGEAKVYTLTLNGSSYLEHIYSTGELFGEFEALNLRPYLSTIKASSVCEAVRIDNEVFLDWMRADPEFSLFVSQQMADKLYQSSLNDITNIIYPLRYRVLYFLWNISQNGGKIIRKEDVVAGLGSNERSVNRIVRDLVNALLIDYDSGIITIPDAESLATEMKRFE